MGKTSELLIEIKQQENDDKDRNTENTDHDEKIKYIRHGRIYGNDTRGKIGSKN